VPHLGDLSDEVPNRGQKGRKVSALAKAIEMLRGRDPLNAKHERRRLFLAARQFVAEALRGGAQVFRRPSIGCDKLVRRVLRQAIAYVLDNHVGAPTAREQVSGRKGALAIILSQH